MYAYRHYRQRLKRGSELTQIDFVLFCGDESVGFGLLLNAKQIANVSFRVGVVIAICGFGDGLNASLAELQKKILGARNPAKGHRA